LHHELISDHLSKEVKKRGAKTLHWDVSYKEPKHLCQYQGQSIFKGIVTAMNELGEVRMQFHVYSDSHDQMITAIQSLKKTNHMMGMADPCLFITDNPKGDKKFFTSMFETINEQQILLDTHSDEIPGRLPCLDDSVYQNANVSILSRVGEINLAICAMRDTMKNKVVGLDCEWPVTLNRHGHLTASGKIALIQICHHDEEDKLQVLLLRVGSMKSLPHRLASFLCDNTIQFSGVRVSADLTRIGADFKVEGLANVLQKFRANVINLGPYARKRDVVQNGTVSLAELCKTVLEATLDKSAEDRFSDWNQHELTESQVKYAALDAIVSLAIFIELEKQPDLTCRLLMDEAVPGKKIDLVPIHGSASTMATRAATGYILEDTQCNSPNDILPKSVRAGEGSVIVEIIEVYSPGLKIPRYKHKLSQSQASLKHFNGYKLVVPVNMLKEHIESDKIRSTPIEDSNTIACCVTTPDAEVVEEHNPLVDCATPTGQVNNEENNHVGNERSEETVDGNNVDNGTIEESFDEQCDGELTSTDIESIRAAIQHMDNAEPNRAILKCAGLSDAPMPEDIVNKFSSVLGDAFHAMDRTKVPVKHEAKKAFFVALREAFLMWNEEKKKELENHMRSEGMTDDEVKMSQYFSPGLCRDCVDRCVPPPNMLYWRLRAVYALYGHMKDSKTNAPLFNDNAWKKANNVLNEILDGLYSDPPGVQWYTKRLRGDGTVMRNKYGMEMYDCSRGTNRVESYHKELVTTFGSWHTGILMSVVLLSERRHRQNHHCSERRRAGFPRVGHVDTWELEELQSLVYRNHGFLLYPSLTNSSEYATTSETFDTVALQNFEVHEALKERCKEIAPTKLSHDLKYLCNAMGTDLPFLPFSNDDEKMKFSQYARHNLPIKDDIAAVEWCRRFVDGDKIMPKLPCHIRIHIDKWDRNQRIKESFVRSATGRNKLEELNTITQLERQEEHSPDTAQPIYNINQPQNSSTTPNTDSDRIPQQPAWYPQPTFPSFPMPQLGIMHAPIPYPPTLPMPTPRALHNAPYATVWNSCIGENPIRYSKQVGKPKKAPRGKDSVPRCIRRCTNCITFEGINGIHIFSCKGRFRSACEYYDSDGNKLK
jgi:hypothetical protein